MFQRYHLKNKTEVILVPQNDTQSVTVQILYPVGSRYEPEKLAGVSHYVEHLMFKGTKKRKNTQILTGEIDRLGAEYNAFTSKEYTGYYIKVDANYSRIAIDILSDMLFFSTFDPKEMEREKGPIIEELRMYADNPMMNIDTIFENLLFAGSPMGRDIGGTVKHVQSYQRDEVLRFKTKYYSPANMTVVVAGRIDKEVEDMVQEFFASQPAGKRYANDFKPSTWGTKKIVVEEKKTDQAQMMMGFPGFTCTAPERAAESVLNTIFGGSMSSRLFIQIRERRGLAYVVRSGSDHFRDTGYSYVRIGLEAKNINPAIKVVKQEIEKILTKGVTKKELADAKTHIRGSMTLSLEDSSVQANWYGKQALFMPKIETPEEVLTRIDAVTQKDVQAVAKKLFKMSAMRVAVIGDVKKEDIVM